MKLQSFKRIFSKDFKSEDQDLVDKLALSVNQGIEDVHLALANRLTFSENFKAQIQDITITVDSNGTPVSNTLIKVKDSSLNPSGLLIIGCRNLKNAQGYPSSAPFIFWTSTDVGLKINNITGLTANVEYSIRVLVF